MDLLFTIKLYKHYNQLLTLKKNLNKMENAKIKFSDPWQPTDIKEIGRGACGKVFSCTLNERGK